MGVRVPAGRREPAPPCELSGSPTGAPGGDDSYSPGVKLGDIANADAAANGKPLDGVRVLAVEQMQALPYATQLLARLGAEVVKIEPPTGESGRGSLPGMRDPVRPARRRHVPAQQPQQAQRRHRPQEPPPGRDLVLRMAPRFDVVAENFKPGTAERLGLGYADIAAVHPDGRLRVGVGLRATSSSRRTPSGPPTRRWPRRCRGSTSTPARDGAAPACRTRSARSATSAPRCSR